MPHAHSPLALALLVPLGAPTRTANPPPKVLVLTIGLNNIHKTAPDPGFPERIVRLADALRSRLSTACGYEIVRVDPAREAAAQATEGYFYGARSPGLCDIGAGGLA